MIHKILVFCGETETVTTTRIDIKNSVKKKICKEINWNILYDFFEFDDDVQIINSSIRNYIKTAIGEK